MADVSRGNATRTGPVPPRKPKAKNPILQSYLILYNTLSLLAWSIVLLNTLSFLINSPTVPHLNNTKLLPPTASSKLTSLLSFGKTKLQESVSRSSSGSAKSTSLPSSSTGILAAVKNHLSGSYVYKDLGPWVVLTQTGALLEVVHAALGWVRSSPVTVGMQVASRIWMVWGIVETRTETHFQPLFTTMILAWSITECIRYSFYACNLIGIEPKILTWLRYNTFYLLYPLGAGSEAFLMFSTLPKLSTLPASLKATLKYGRQGKWAYWAKMLTSGRKAGVGQAWGAYDYLILGLFVIWWPALYVLYTHMIKLRRKVYNQGGQKLGNKKRI